MKTTVFATIEVEGTHKWAGCPFDEVSYLRITHRHCFGIKCWKSVNHDDRDVEFIMLKHAVRHYLELKYWNEQSRLLDFGMMSCEMIAKELIAEFGLVKCSVNEDGENGAEVEA